MFGAISPAIVLRLPIGLRHLSIRLAFVAEAPLRGHMRKELSKLPLRFWIVQRYPNYIIVYDPKTKPLQIIRILHGKRNLKRISAP